MIKRFLLNIIKYTKYTQMHVICENPYVADTATALALALFLSFSLKADKIARTAAGPGVHERTPQALASLGPVQRLRISSLL